MPMSILVLLARSENDIRAFFRSDARVWQRLGCTLVFECPKPDVISSTDLEYREAVRKSCPPSERRTILGFGLDRDL